MRYLTCKLNDERHGSDGYSVKCEYLISFIYILEGGIEDTNQQGSQIMYTN